MVFRFRDDFLRRFFIFLDFLFWGRDLVWLFVCFRFRFGFRSVFSVWSFGIYVFEDRVCGRFRVVAVDEEVLVYSDDFVVFFEVVVEEE